MSIDEASLELIQECVQRKSPVFFSASEVNIVFQTYIMVIKNRSIVLANTVPPEHITGVAQSQQYFLKIHSVRFVSDRITTDGVHILFPLEGLRLIEDSRSAKRFMFDASERVVMEVVNPIDQETVLRKAILDMSTTGLSIRTPMQSKLYTPGQRFEKMKIIMDGKVYNEVDGHVVYQQTFLNQKGKSYCQVGFKFDNVP
ncbi:PilZ domain-containing protein [Oligoflexus tunisiensis]|uniref:PilZ domain-containing protein n=1 Tax=Oligoflexus tunisiensis TaxID=708132 RepID=UPI00114CF3CE|nr:PilZ domain-containing protein [Oligoflexus tunisiensis]